ncbi:MAG: tyrosine-protein phosphatase [Bordetella sp.]|jgi:protein tyrosine/serine phosphatase
MPTLATTLKDWFDYWLVDHGFLRAYFTNRYELPGPLYRANQPSPGRVRWYKNNLGVKTIVNLRGNSPTNVFFRMEQRACAREGITMVSLHAYSRAVLYQEDFQTFKDVIDSLQCPAVVHCKSGSDRAGFFAVLWRHWRLGEPIKQAMSELHWKYGHFKTSSTGMIDHFFQTYIDQAKPGQSLMDWVQNDFDPKAVEASFRPQALSRWLVDRLLRRE